MNWLRAHKQSAILVCATLALPLMVFMYLLVQLLSASAATQAEIERLEPRIARMQGLRDAEAQMTEALQTVADYEGVVYAASQDQASVAAALQAEVRRLLGEAGMEITNSQVLPVVELERFDRVAISVMATGSIESLDTALASMAVYRPLLLVESLDVYPNRPRRNDSGAQQSLTARLQIMSLRSAI